MLYSFNSRFICMLKIIFELLPLLKVQLSSLLLFFKTYLGSFESGWQWQPTKKSVITWGWSSLEKAACSSTDCELPFGCPHFEKVRGTGRDALASIPWTLNLTLQGEDSQWSFRSLLEHCSQQMGQLSNTGNCCRCCWHCLKTRQPLRTITSQWADSFHSSAGWSEPRPCCGLNLGSTYRIIICLRPLGSFHSPQIEHIYFSFLGWDPAQITS